MTPALRRILLAAGVVAGLVVVLYAMTALRSGGTAPPKTSVAGVDISGMTPEAAAAAVIKQYGPLAHKRLKVTASGQTFVIKPAPAGIRLDAEASVAPAFGRTWNPASLVGHLFGATSLPLVTSVDDAALATQVQTIADTLDVAPTLPTLTIKNGQPRLTPGTEGMLLDKEATSASLIDALLKPRAPVPAVITTVEPAISAAAARQAEDLAKAAVSAPVSVTAGTTSATIPAAAIGKALSFTADGSALTPVLDGAVLHDAIRDQLKAIETKGSDATFKIKSGVPVVVPSVVGRGISDDELSTAVAAVLSSPEGQRTVTVSVGLRDPKLTSAEAQGLGITELLSKFTQHFPYAAYRVQNIGQAAKRVDGTLLMPGETFSMNDTIKERTEANGYTIGFVVGEGGVFDEQLGGGVSTATTTVWTAAFFAGMERVQTVAHSIYISRYQPGLEATVAWGLFDMKFKNPYPDPVFIKATTTNGSMTVSFWGTKVYDKIEAEFGKRTNVTKFPTVYDSTKKCLGQAGVDGFWITVDRVFYKDGAEVSREPIATHYKPAPKVICGKDPNPDTPGTKPSSGSSAGPSASPSGKPSSKPSSKPSPKPSSSSTTPSDTFVN
jgi:vancomycin resistance protein YoaR